MLNSSYQTGYTIVMGKILQLWLALLFAMGLAACSGNTQIESDLSIKGAPDWVNEGTQAIKNKDGRLIHGRGEAAPMGDASLQKATADNRARAEIARVLSTIMQDTLADYSSSSAGEADGSVAREISSSTRLALSGTRILGHWKDQKTGIIYALAELDTKSLDKSIATATRLSDNFKQQYIDHLDANFDRFVEDGKP
jgi:hypothetical protein